MNNTTRMGMLLGLIAITALCMAPRVRAGGGTFYSTVTNVTQLVTDINYANTNGGTFTINLQPNKRQDSSRVGKMRAGAESCVRPGSFDSAHLAGSALNAVNGCAFLFNLWAVETQFAGTRPGHLLIVAD